ncbi:MAG: exodeoxyribonuclease VII large subunit [Clostridia bacterium]|nr:exodeoxyribonuclease VII large subunit [Clostridia bacterium]
MENNALTVTQLTEIIKMTIDGAPYLNRVAVSGEISNFNHHFASGHMYFTLKDEGAQLKCVMFRSQNINLRIKPENGMKVLCTGRISVYPQDGRYQLYVNDIIEDGIGALYIEAERVRKKLEAEGVFSEKLKRPLPQFPKKIGVITSQTGAAVRDIINIAASRYPACEIIVYPAIVQGEYAVKTLIDGLAYFNKAEKVDTIIIGRGGGSIEDLQPFNTEDVAYAVRASEIPVISAVGHETDFTVCDFAADVRASTPSHAAELAVPDSKALRDALDSDLYKLKRIIEKIISDGKASVEKAASSRAFTSLESQITDRRQMLDTISGSMADKLNIILLKRRKEFETAAARLDSTSPLKVLSRGYSFVEKDGVPVSDASKIKTGDNINVTMNNGVAAATVYEVKLNGKQ